MPIDITQEPLITLAEATGFVPRRRRGRKTSVTTLYRWSTTGSRGVVLETIQVAGSRCTSVAALQRFFDRLTAASGTSATPVSRCKGSRAEAADRELARRWRGKGACLLDAEKRTQIQEDLVKKCEK